MINFSEKIKSLRQQNHLTQAALAQKLSVTKSVVSAYENDLRRPSYEVLVQLARIFNVTTDYLLGIEHKSSIDLSGLTETEKTALLNLINAMRKK